MELTRLPPTEDKADKDISKKPPLVMGVVLFYNKFMKKGQKLYIIRKYIMARSAPEAIKKSMKRLPDDCWVDDDWRKEHPSKMESVIGFDDEE